MSIFYPKIDGFKIKKLGKTISTGTVNTATTVSKGTVNTTKIVSKEVSQTANQVGGEIAKIATASLGPDALKVLKNMKVIKQAIAEFIKK